ncbi:hypothetical protein [Streptomyces sp. A0592]|uniref:hypothetical protein n=1 Tax=Streptomyces sp. A0592 TaxID=2563099 RepID=UPI00109E98C8|nr:hypothetical protein [Streptomyces sp. A0592]THA79776.1 hypothetical protein E6U81_31755 [Streptomyces sp. A0592]
MISELAANLDPSRHERHQAKLVSRPRMRAVGASAGAKRQLVLIDRLLVTLIHSGVPTAAPAGAAPSRGWIDWNQDHDCRLPDAHASSDRQPE